MSSRIIWLLRAAGLVTSVARFVLADSSSIIYVGASAYSNDTAYLECTDAFQQLLDPKFANALVIANDASSTLRIDAFNLMNSYRGYPGSIGDYVECTKVQSFSPNPSDSSASAHLCLAGSYALGTLDATPPYAGICVPTLCTAETFMGPYIGQWLGAVNDQLLASNDTTETQIEYIQNIIQVYSVAGEIRAGFTCGTFKEAKFGYDAQIVCGCMLILFLFVIGATVKDQTTDPDYPKYSSDHALSPTREYTRALAALKKDDDEDHVPQYLAAFSISRNLDRILSVRSQTELSMLDGLKVISMLWVILGHFMSVMASIGVINPEDLYSAVEHIGGQLLFSANFAVDTFFFITGFLVVHVMLKRLSTPDSIFGKVRSMSCCEWLPWFYMHRIVRILPSYVFCLLLWWKVAPWLGNGPFWYRFEDFINLCEDSWWTNLLFVNNLIPWGRQQSARCFYVAWYLANDMQFYVLSPIFIVLYLKSSFTGGFLTGLLLVASLVGMGLGSYWYNWSALSLDGQWTISYSEDTYTVPWFRAVPYLMGIGFAMFWNRRINDSKPWHLESWQRFMCIWSSIIIFLAVIFCAVTGYQMYPCEAYENPDSSQCGSGWSVYLRIAYNTLTRPIWCLGLMLLCLPCFSNQGGLIQQILSHRVWTPFSRLSLGAYLMHPIVINLWLLNSSSKFYFSYVNMVMLFLGVTAATYLCAILVAILVECPVSVLYRHFEVYMQESSQHSRSNSSGSSNSNRKVSPVSIRENNGMFEVTKRSPSFNDAYRSQEYIWDALSSDERYGPYGTYNEVAEAATYR